MSFSDNLIGRLFSWGGVNFLIVEVDSDNVIAVCRNEHGRLERVRTPTARVLQTLDVIEVTLSEVPELAHSASTTQD